MISLSTNFHLLCLLLRVAETHPITSGTADPYEEAVFLVAHATRLSPSVLEPLADARLTPSEIAEVLDLLSARILQRIPAPYLAQTAVLSERTFFVDRRVLIPRSFIAELLPALAGNPHHIAAGADGVRSGTSGQMRGNNSHQ